MLARRHSRRMRARRARLAQEFVYIKRTGGGLDADEVFAPLSIDGVASVGLLAKRACTEFGWGVPTQMRLYIVTTEESARALERGGSAAGILAGDALFSGDALERAGIASGSWLLARISGDSVMPTLMAELVALKLGQEALKSGQEALAGSVKLIAYASTHATWSGRTS